MSARTSLKQTEAAERAALLEVERYDVELDFTDLLDGDVLRTTSRITFRATPGAATFLDCQAEVVDMTLNGTPLPADAVEGDRIRLTGLAEHNELEVRSVQRETSSALGVHRVVDPADGEVYVWTTFEPDEARRVFACFDQPDLKAVFAITALVPERWTATSNTGDARVAGDGATRTWRFADTPPLSTYNIVCNAGPFHELRSERGGHDLGLYCRRSLADVLERDAEELFETTAAGLAFFGEQFALPFPQHRYDQVFVPEFGAGAMENFGCVTWIDSALYRTPPTAAQRERRARILLHEMAHMWFGDMVTMRWWDDLWLNESFAEWACHWAAERVTEFTDVWAADAVDDKVRAYAADLAPTTHPIRRGIPDVEATRSTVDAITYPKGASALRQLVHLAGEDAFVAALQGYFAGHAWGNTTLDDLVRAVEQAAGRDLTPWVDGWLGTAGPDPVAARRDGESVVVEIEPPAGRGPLPHRLDVAVYDVEDGALTLRATHDLEPTGPVRIDDVPADALVLLNAGDHTFAGVRPDDRSLELLTRHAGSLPRAVDRALAVTTVWGLMYRGLLGAERLVTSAVDVLRAETAASVVEPVFRLATGAAEQWASPADRERLTCLLADTTVSLLDHPDHRPTAIRGLATVATTDEQLAVLDRLAADHPDDTALQWARLTRLARLGRLDLDEVDALQERDPDPEAWRNALAARVARPDATAKREGWDALFADTARLGFPGIRGVSQAFWLAGHEPVLGELTEEFAACLPGLTRLGSKFAGYVTACLFPVVAVDEPYLDRVLAAAEHPDVLDVVRNRVRERADVVRRMLTARSLG